MRKAAVSILSILSIWTPVSAQSDEDQWLTGDMYVNFEEGSVSGQGVCLDIPFFQAAMCVDYKLSICDAASAYIKLSYGSSCDNNCENGDVLFEGDVSIDDPIKLDELGIDAIPDGLELFLTKNTRFLPGYAMICPGIKLPIDLNIPDNPFIKPSQKINFECIEVGSDCGEMYDMESCAGEQYCGWCSKSERCLHNFFEFPLCDECEETAYGDGFLYHDKLVDYLEYEEIAREEAVRMEQEEQEQKEKNTKIGIIITVVVLALLALIAIGVCCFKKKKANNGNGYSPSGPVLGTDGKGKPAMLQIDEEDELEHEEGGATNSNYHHPVFVQSHPAANEGVEVGQSQGGDSETYTTV